MSDLIDKLNVLLRSSLSNFLGGASESPSPRKISPDVLGKDVDREIAALRKQVDTALSEEDKMKARIEELERQIADHDQQADRALERGDESLARQLVQQMQREKRQLRQMEAELDQHRNATFDLMQHVNTLEAMVSDARREQAEKAPPPEEAPPPEAQRTPGNVLSDMLRNVRERVEETINKATTPPPPDETPSITTVKPATSQLPDSEAPGPTSIKVKVGPSAEPSKTDIRVNKGPAPEQATPANKSADKEVDDDLANRRARLSKPD